MTRHCSRWLWFGIACCCAWVLAGSVVALVAAGLFVLLIILPATYLLEYFVRRSSLPSGITRHLALASFVVATPGVLLLRHALPIAPGWFDVFAVTGLAAATWFRSGFRDWLQRFAVGSGPESPQLLWLCFVLPGMAALSWLGHAVPAEDGVRYYGLFFVDFGNLTSIVNAFAFSPGLPESAVVGTGPLSYHWFFFALPAWLSSFLGIGIPTANALALCNLGSAMLFFVTLSTLCRTVLSSTRPTAPPAWSANAAGLGIVGMSVLYGWQIAMRLLAMDQFTETTRNHLLLQLPNSLNVFGNNTFALTLCILAVVLLISWNERRDLRYIVAAAVCVSLLPAYSVTLTLSMALGITVAALGGLFYSRVRLLGIFAITGATFLAIFGSLGVLGGGGSGRAISLKLHWDGSQFARNVMFAFLPASISIVWCAFKARERVVLTILCLILGCVAIPSLLTLDGSATAIIDLSMKTASLILTLATPLAGVLMWDLFASKTQARPAKLAFATLIGLAALNTTAYILQFPYYRLTGRGSRYVTVDGDHYNALEYIRTHSSSDSVLLDGESVEYESGNPGVMLAARRVFLPSKHNQKFLGRTSELEGRLERWHTWRGSGFRDEELAAYFAERCDLLLCSEPVYSNRWILQAHFGQLTLLRSAVR